MNQIPVMKDPIIFYYDYNIFNVQTTFDLIANAQFLDIFQLKDK